MSKQYKGAVDRLWDAHRLTEDLWDHAPDIEPDLVSVYEAIQAWPWIPTCYSLIEQAFKLIWGTRKGIELDEIRKELVKKIKKPSQAHDLNILFKNLDLGDQESINTAYESYQDLHNYIPILNANEFLEKIGDGYTNWRYLLLEGTKGIPITHVGAMLEVAKSSVSILRDEYFTRHGFVTVDRRVQRDIENAITQDMHAFSSSNSVQISENFRVKCLERMNYVCGLIRKNPNYMISMLSSQNPRENNLRAAERNILNGICVALSMAERKNSIQYLRRGFLNCPSRLQA